MTPAPWTVPASATLEEAARLMRSWDVREAFVVDGGVLCGVPTDTDIMVWAIASGRSPLELLARDCVAPSSPRVAIDESVAVALDYMRRHDAQRVPVVDGDELVGAAWLDDVERAVRADTGARPGPCH
jgi:CBS domain-containing protein